MAISNPKYWERWPSPMMPFGSRSARPRQSPLRWHRQPDHRRRPRGRARSHTADRSGAGVTASQTMKSGGVAETPSGSWPRCSIGGAFCLSIFGQYSPSSAVASAKAGKANSRARIISQAINESSIIASLFCFSASAQRARISVSSPLLDGYDEPEILPSPSR